MTTIGIPKEIYPDERRVAATPASVQKLLKLGYEVLVQSGAGEPAHYDDEAYTNAGAAIAIDAPALWSQADFILKVRAPMENAMLDRHEVDMMKQGAGLASYIWPAQTPELLEKFAEKKATVFAIDSLPRISRAQKMDALSAMANVAGYRAVIEAANHFGRFFTGQVTAAGKVPPAKIMVIGAGVAGLAAVGTANSMGAIVRAFDTRLEVKEQVESMGAEFLELDFGDEDGSGGGGYAKQMSDEFIKAEMARTGAIFGGEHSGHFYFADFWRADSGMLAALHVLAALGDAPETTALSTLLAPFDQYSASGEINSVVGDVDSATARVRAHFADAPVTVDDLDGLTVQATDWWFNLRPSNTEPLLRLNVEAQTSEVMTATRDVVLGLIRS